MSDNSRTIIATNHDMGSALAMVPALKKLEEEGWQVLACSHQSSPAFGVFKAAGYKPVGLGKILKIRPDLVLVGVSTKDYSVEKTALHEAKRLGIPVAVIVESWPHRWLDVYGKRDKPLYQKADRILLVDEFSCDHMASQGFDRAKLVATGNPSQDSYADLAANRAEHRRKARERFGIPEDALVFQWSMSCDLDDPAQDRPGHAEWSGFYELDSLIEFFGAVREAASWPSERRIVGFVRQKPTHGSTRVKRYALQIGAGTCYFDNGRDTGIPLLLASDVVFGAVTMMVQNAAMLGVPGIFYFPDLNKPNPMVCNQLGFTKAITARYGLRDFILMAAAAPAHFFEDLKKELRPIALPTDATDNVVQAIKALVNR